MPAPRTAPERAAITGASGFVGRALAASLARDGCAVVRVGRGASADVRWNPARGEIDAVRLGAPDVVVHLAGAPINARWTTAHKRAIRDSRVHGTELIARACANASPRPRVLVSASAVGVYGDRGDEVLTEESAPGDGFLGDVARAWEASTRVAEDAGIRVVHARFGIALARDGGVLEAMLPAFRLGLGGPFGSGTQWMSWIERDDLVRAIRFVMDGTLRGAVNVVAPNPVTNGNFVRALGRALHRPALLRAPAFALRAVLGELADGALLSGQRVVPQKLLNGGFTFQHPTLAGALAAALRSD